jgi:hypothetical protein
MTHTHPVITFKTRRKTAIGYCSFYDDRPEHPSHGLVPAMWSEYATGDGCQASTPADMTIYLRMLLNRGQGPQGRLISEESFDLLAHPGVWTGVDYYGYALATYAVHGHTYLGHGGGNASFMSAIMMDMENGLGVILLVNRTGNSDKMVEAAQHILTILRAVHCHEEIPLLPPERASDAIPNASEYTGVYRAGDRVLQLMAEEGRLLLDYAGRVVALERRAPDRFYVGHPDLDLFLLEFGRHDGEVVEALHGSDWYLHDRCAGRQRVDHPEAWNAYLGHYRARNPELSNFRVVLRKGALVLIFPSGDAEALYPLGDDVFRIGEDPRSPETLRFAAVSEGGALRADYSGCPYYRTFTC